ncbi:MAG: M15 family metallopeptidase [Pseudomonadota bacterium]
MKRREFIKAVAGIMGIALFPAGAFARKEKISSFDHPRHYDEDIKDYLLKMRNFNRQYKGDVYLSRERYHLLQSSVDRLKRLQQTIGYANFHLLNFDSALKIADSSSKVNEFPRAELDFLETIFYEDAALLGFLGAKPLRTLTDQIQMGDVVKVPHTGHYLYKGQPFETYTRIKKIVGDQLVLTSGVRSVVKQFLLFLNKAYANEGNLSLASRQLAPPGYSYHGIGDFDVGQDGFGTYNFTEEFIYSDVYNKLEELGYLSLRYPQDNLLGVRFEPWHIKVKGTT